HQQPLANTARPSIPPAAARRRGQGPARHRRSQYAARHQEGLGQPQQQLASWDPAADHCGWKGVTCADQGTGGVVVELSLPNLNLAGIGPGVCNLTRLDLSYNNLTGDFPAAAIFPCAQLRYLDLSNNNFFGPIPDDIDGISPAMEHLNLSTNSFAGEVPVAVAWLPKLKSLLLDTNRFTGAYPAAEISRLFGLEVLTLANNSFSPAPVPLEFAKLTNLTYLWMSDMNLTGGIPEAFSALTELRTIAMSRNNLTGTIPAWVLQHKKIELMCNNDLSGPLPETLCANGLLYDIVAFNNSFSGELPANLGDCVLLNNLMLYNNRFSGEFPEKIWSFPKLTTVMIQNNSFTGALPAVISFNISRIEMGNNMFSGSVPASATGLQVFKAENNRLDGELPADMSMLANLTDFLGLIILFSMFAGIVLVGSVVIAWLLFRRRRENHQVIDWKMTAFTQLNFTESDVVRNLREENVIGSGGSGKYGHMPKVNQKVDVYSFGVVLLELTTGKVANDSSADLCLAEWAWQRYQKGAPFNDVVDEAIRIPAFLQDILLVFTLGVICTGENPLERPSMKEVLQQLIRCARVAEEAAAYQMDCNGDLEAIKNGTDLRA
ncbi:hypothetical protein EJB05_41230, partial [Eragrostis curvula]